MRTLSKFERERLGIRYRHEVEAWYKAEKLRECDSQIPNLSVTDLTRQRLYGVKTTATDTRDAP